MTVSGFSNWELLGLLYKYEVETAVVNNFIDPFYQYQTYWLFSLASLRDCFNGIHFDKRARVFFAKNLLSSPGDL